MRVGDLRLSAELARACRRLRMSRTLRDVFVRLVPTYRTFWEAFALLPGVAEEGVLADVGDDEARFWESGRLQAESVLPLIPPSATVLDLGGGVGRVARWVAPRCAELILVDVSGGMLRRARANLRGCGAVRFERSDGRTLSGIPRDTVDVAYSFLVLQHLEREDVISYLAELHRVLRPGGVFHFQVPNLNARANLKRYVHYSLNFPTRSIARVRYYAREEVELLLAALGFDTLGIDQPADFLFVTARKARRTS